MENHIDIDILVLLDLMKSLNSISDYKRCVDEIYFEEVKEEVLQGNIIKFLHNKYGNYLDLDFLSKNDMHAVNNGLKSIATKFHQHERLELKVYNDGICTLLAYIIELIITVISSKKV